MGLAICPGYLKRLKVDKISFNVSEPIHLK
jgi:hypothetical protein